QASPSCASRFRPRATPCRERPQPGARGQHSQELLVAARPDAGVRRVRPDVSHRVARRARSAAQRARARAHGAGGGAAAQSPGPDGLRQPGASVRRRYVSRPGEGLLQRGGPGGRVHPLTEVYPGAITNALIISPVFAQSQPEAARRFVTAQMRGQREFWHAFIRKDTPAAQDEIIEVLTKYTPVKDPRQWRETVMPSVGLNGELSDAMVDDFQN